MINASPCNKRRWYEKSAAKAWARRHAQLNKGKPMRPYHCEACDGYHLTSQNRKADEWHKRHPDMLENPRIRQAKGIAALGKQKTREDKGCPESE